MQAETALRDSEAKYRGLFESMTEGFALYELVEDDRGRPVDWRVLEVNEAYSRHTGVSRDHGRRPADQRALSRGLRGIPADLRPRRGHPDAGRTSKRTRRPSTAIMHVVTFPVGGRRFASLIEDISARRKAEEALRDSEERYRALFNNMTEGFALHEIVTDASGRPVDYLFIDVNPAFERLTGLRRSDVVGRRVREVLQDIEPYWIDAYGRVALTGEPLTFERYYPEPLNRWFEIYAYRPAPRQFAVVFMDITSRKRAEEALRESENAAREIAGDRAPRELGARPDGRPADLVGRGLPDLRSPAAGVRRDLRGLPGRGPSGRPRGRRRRLPELRARRPRQLRDRAPDRPPGLPARSGPSTRNASISGTPRDRIVRSVGMVHDITERKRAEALRQVLIEQERLRLGAAVEQASEAVVMADPDGRILYVNAAFETINRLSKSAAVTRNCFELIAGDPRSVEMRASVGRGEAWTGHLKLERPGERAVELEVVATPVKEPPGILITERDITQEVILQEQVRQAQKMEALGTLAGGIAHDFNNILGAITINTELALLDTEEGCKARESLPLILRAAERGKELVKQIVTFSRQREWERSPLKITPAVQEALTAFPGHLARVPSPCTRRSTRRTPRSRPTPPRSIRSCRISARTPAWPCGASRAVWKSSSIPSTSTRPWPPGTPASTPGLTRA